jgi:hypothetical protein
MFLSDGLSGQEWTLVVDLEFCTKTLPKQKWVKMWSKLAHLLRQIAFEHQQTSQKVKLAFISTHESEALLAVKE